MSEKLGGGIMTIFVIIGGIIAFFIMELPLLFFLGIVPLVVILIAAFIGWLVKK